MLALNLDRKHLGCEQRQELVAKLGGVEKFTRQGDTVLDPFLGGGATAVAALQLDRLFIGGDDDEDAIMVTLARLREQKPAAYAMPHARPRHPKPE